MLHFLKNTQMLSQTRALEGELFPIIVYGQLVDPLGTRGVRAPLQDLCFKVCLKNGIQNKDTHCQA